MKNTGIAKQVKSGAEFSGYEAIIGKVEESMEKIVDISNEADKVIAMTPKEGYLKKNEIISNADDLSIDEKLKVIDAVGDKYSEDLDKNAVACTRMMWTKVKIVLVGTAVVVFMVSTPAGRSVARSLLKHVA